MKVRFKLRAAGIAIAAMLHAGSASAQDAPPTAAADEPEQNAEIVVTAQKREQRLQDVPVTVTVVGDEQLSNLGITDFTQITKAVPALSVVGGGSGALQIRGVGTIGYSANSEPSVSVVIDGVVMPRMAGAIFSGGGLTDVQRVEVLSGPQGTLFGKNASAGVLNIVTKQPEFGSYEFSAHAEIGERHTRLVQATANLPVSDTAALRLSGNYSAYGDVVVSTLYGASRDWSDGFRGRFRWEPSDSLSINLFADYQHSDSNGIRAIVGPIRKVGAGTLLATRLAACGVTAGPENNRQCAEAVSTANGFFSPNDSFGGSVQIDYSFGEGYTLTSITADRHFNYGNIERFNVPVNDGDNTPLPIVTSNPLYNRSETFSQELRLTSPTGGLIEYVAGIYYSKYQSNSKSNLVIATSSAQSDTRGDLSSRAVFGQATINATPQLRFIAGGRVTDETLTEVTVVGNQPGYTFLAAFSPHNTTVKTQNFSWRLGAQYDFTPDVMMFATVSRGYKGPQINTLPPNSFAPPIVQPEIPTNYELGLKTSLFGRRLFANLTGFYQKVDNFQTVVAVPSQNGSITVFSTGNSPYIKTKGLDLNLFGSPTPGLNLSANFLYNDATYAPTFIVPCPQGTPADCDGDGRTGVRSVENVIFAPKWKIRLSADYEARVTDGIELFLGGDLSYTSRFNYSSTPDPNLRSDAYTVLGGRIGLRSPDDRWGVYVFGRNLTDERVPQMVAGDSSGSLNGGAGTSYTHNLGIDSYRVVGVAIDLKL